MKRLIRRALMLMLSGGRTVITSGLKINGVGVASPGGSFASLLDMGTANVATFDKLTSTMQNAARLGYSLRNVRNSSGACVRIRRDSDNAEKDFGFSAGVLDWSAVSAWLGAATGYVRTWYNQFGYSDAIWATAANQPRIAIDSFDGKPSIFFDGAQILDTQMQINALTKNGVDGSVFAVLYPTSAYQFTFGVCDLSNPNNRWSSHTDGQDSGTYFNVGTGDPNNRLAWNSSDNDNKYGAYTFTDLANATAIRWQGALKQTLTMSGAACTSAETFKIGGAYLQANWSVTRFREFLMFNIGLDASAPASDITVIEQDQMNWAVPNGSPGTTNGLAINGVGVASTNASFPTSLDMG